MSETSKHRTDIAKQSDEQRVARERMALFPADAEVLFVHKDLWVVSEIEAFVLCSIDILYPAGCEAGTKTVHPSWHSWDLPKAPRQSTTISGSPSS